MCSRTDLASRRDCHITRGRKDRPPATAAAACVGLHHDAEINDHMRDRLPNDVELGNHHAISVLLENVRDAHHHDVVGINQCDADWCPHCSFQGNFNLPRGVMHPPLGWLSCRRSGTGQRMALASRSSARRQRQFAFNGGI